LRFVGLSRKPDQLPVCSKHHYFDAIHLAPSNLPTASILTGRDFGAVTLVTLGIVVGHRRLGHD
jgi:hypothetical protein